MVAEASQLDRDGDGCLSDSIILAQVEGRATAAQVRTIDVHVDGCDACRALLARVVLAASSGRLPPGSIAERRTTEQLGRRRPARRWRPPGTLVGRFVLGEVLGVGGMGTVCAAHDPRLDRQVALKLIERGDGSSDAVLREAQSMARLQHENVVAIYDTGEVEHEVFIAMELVEGVTLAQWMRQQRRGWRQVVEVFVQAGRGLAAAHAAGIVHRDFKPENVLIAGDGRVKVGDFGLAIPAGGPSGVAGTPAYMAPEHLAGERPCATGDQFSFFVALYEALHGRRPFRGANLSELADRARRGVIDAAGEAPIPRWLRRVVLRGLSARKEDRFASLDAAVAQLSRGLHARRKGLVVLVVAPLLALVAGLVALTARPIAVPTCQGAEQRLLGVWDPSRRAQVRQAFAATTVPFAATALAGAERTLDAYAAGWVEMRTEACVETQTRREQTPALLDLRMACLDRHLARLDALVLLFADADAKVVKNAVAAAQALPELDECADRQTLLAMGPSPTAPALRDRVRAVRAWMATAVALRDTGRYRASLLILEPLEAEVDAIAHAPLTAEYLYQRAFVLVRTGKREAGLADLRRVELEAETGRHDLMRASSYVQEGILLQGTGALDEARLALDRADAIATRLDSRKVRAYVAEARGTLLLEQARLPEALEAFDAALALADRPDEASSLNAARARLSRAQVLDRLARDDEARREAEQAVAMLERALGPEHPDTAMGRSIVADLLLDEQRYDEAMAEYRRAREVIARAVGPRSREVWPLDNAIAMVHEAKGEWDEAVATYRDARDLAQEVFGPDHPNLILATLNLGNGLLGQRRYPEAIARYAEVLATAERVFGHEHLFVAHAEEGTGTALQRLRRPREALPRFREAARIFALTEGPSHPDTARALASVAELAGHP